MIEKNIPKPKLNIKSVTNPDLFGTWQHVASGRKFMIDTNSFYYIVGDTSPYSVNSTTLDMDGWIFNRINGTGSDIIGEWREPYTNEEVTFRTDLTFTWHDPNPAVVDTFGNYSVTSSPELLTMVEARSYLIENGTQLIFDSIFSGFITYNFVVSSTQLTLTDPTNGTVIEYVRV
ncbi:MAG: hypothetical protein GY761_14250 [Hyphomicrobiales bacterium]|nr:hypothetical protein [Hyphomicrobiales bacterium]